MALNHSSQILSIRRNVTLAALIASLSLTFPMTADARDVAESVFCDKATQMCGRTINATAYQYPESHIRITRVAFVEFSNGPLENAITLIAGCIYYVNVGPQAVMSVTFTWYPVAKPKSYASLTLTGPIPVGVVQDRDARIYPNSLLAPPHYGSECGLAWGKGAFVSKVVYADGTMWTAPRDAPAGSNSEMTSAQATVQPL